LKRIFLSHSNVDKPALSPLFSELARRGLPIFVDQKGDVAWDSDVRSIAMSSNAIVEDMGPGTPATLIRPVIRDCAIFVLLYSDTCARPIYHDKNGRDTVDGANKRDSAVWREMRFYVDSRTDAPPPLLIQARPIDLQIIPPPADFLDAERPNIIRFGQLDWDDVGHVSHLADRIEAHYAGIERTALIAWHQSLQRQVADKIAGGRLELVQMVQNKIRIDMRLVPTRRNPGRGCYVSREPVAPVGMVNVAISRDMARRAVVRMHPILQVIARTDLADIFPVRPDDGSLHSPFGIAARQRADAFWMDEGGQLVAVDGNGNLSAAGEAFLYVRR
jgi:hypothetical protein